MKNLSPGLCGESLIIRNSFGTSFGPHFLIGAQRRIQSRAEKAAESFIFIL